MATTTKKVLKTTLALGSTGKTLTYTLDNPKDNLDLQTVQTAFDHALNNDLIVKDGTAADTLQKAVIVETTETVLE